MRAACLAVEGYTALAGVDREGDDLIKRCNSFPTNKDIAAEGAALCDKDPACVGFTTWVQGRKAWYCSSASIACMAVRMGTDVKQHVCVPWPWS